MKDTMSDNACFPCSSTSQNKEWTEDWDSESLETSNKIPPRVRIRMTVDGVDGREFKIETQSETMLRVPVRLSTN